jgi:hypothetical protein
MCYGELSLLLVAVRSHISYYEAHRTPVPEQNSSKAEEAEDLVHTPADRRAGEALPQTEIPGVRRAGVSRQNAQDDRRSSQNLVSKSTYKMEVSSNFLYSQFYGVMRLEAGLNFSKFL